MLGIETGENRNPNTSRRRRTNIANRAEVPRFRVTASGKNGLLREVRIVKNTYRIGLNVTNAGLSWIEYVSKLNIFNTDLELIIWNNNLFLNIITNLFWLFGITILLNIFLILTYF